MGSRVDWRIAGLVLVAVAALTRINNALRYKTRMGFDAVENVEYIEHLMGSWALPAPDAAWATSHPPLFYYASALIGRLFAAAGQPEAVLRAIPLLSGLLGIAMALLAGWLVLRRSSQGEASEEVAKRRTLIALGLVLFLPVQIYMSAMVSEEVLVSFLSSLVLLGGLAGVDPKIAKGLGLHTRPVLLAALIGVCGGLAILTKLTGCLSLIAVGIVWLVAGLRAGRPSRVGLQLVVMGVAVGVVGGWFYVRSLYLYGYLYPQGLEIHEVLYRMPPGSRSWLDYLYIPLSTWTNPVLTDPGLLRSVWGSTWTTLYFDGHRHFLPNSVAALQMGRVLLTLALLPAAAFAVGALRGARRALRDPGGVDALLLALVGLTLAGYVAFTLGNPYFATLKGSYLLGLSIPFAYYASEVLTDWTRGPGARSWLVWGILVLLALLVTLSFTIGPIFIKLDGPGLPWRELVQAA